MKTIDSVRQEIIKDNQSFTNKGWEPIFRAHKDAKILIIGQAPGIKTQLEKEVFKDQSGDILRSWMGIDEKIFYDSHSVAVLPMDFYFPGKAKTGDKPPRKDFAKKWHPKLIKLMPKVELIILIGMYANKAYLKDKMESNLTKTVQNYQAYLPQYFTLVHPSPLNRRLMAKNPWFEKDVLPVFKKKVQSILKD
ncbi:MAG TPA: uracil-DNA glycosylase family protein [Erysipelothrix sp.]|nr:uracil-DNA glycosylase family protein [Erysipelothrix sp.]